MPFSLKSRGFKDGDEIPLQFTADGDDISPPLSWSGHPPNTVSFALVVKDSDVRDKDKGIQWVLWNIPATTRALPQGVPNNPVLQDGSCQGRNDFQKVGYSGPRLAQVSEHHYEFTLYALDSKLTLKAGSTCAQLIVDMGGHRPGHILAQTQLVGRFKPERDAARLRALESDQEYILRSDDVKRSLEQAYQKGSSEVTAFFRKFSLPSSFAMEEIREMLKNIGDIATRRSLEDYVCFANRFRVMFHLKTNPLAFKTLVLNPYGEKFHVKIVDDHLEPGTQVPALDDDEPYRDFFESKGLKILGEAQDLVDKGKATFTQIDDGPGYSLLKDLETFAYKDDGVAFFIHNAEQPYLGCIFGEKLTKQLLHDMGPTVTEFQKRHFFRTAGGRPPDMERLKKMQAIDRKPISNKAKAIELADGDEKKIKSQEVKLSNLRRQRNKKKQS
jgi:Raf kinase inhibitor-like YbhB/YbcL family protein